MKSELEKLKEDVSHNTLSVNDLSTSQRDNMNKFTNDIYKRLEDIQTIVETLPNNEDTKMIINSLNELKQSDLDVLLQRSSGIATLIAFIGSVMQLYLSYIPS